MWKSKKSYPIIVFRLSFTTGVVQHTTVGQAEIVLRRKTETLLSPTRWRRHLLLME